MSPSIRANTRQRLQNNKENDKNKTEEREEMDRQKR